MDLERQILASSFDDDIAIYANPPVVEVIAAVRFANVEDAIAMSFGQVWREAFKGEFPNFELVPRYNAANEDLARPSEPPTLQLSITQLPPLPRLWLTSSTKDRLLQLQDDWFACNWRKVQAGSTYGRWPDRRSDFERNWGVLQKWLERLGSPPKVQQCEVTYVNHIFPISGVWQEHSEMRNLFSASAIPAHLSVDMVSFDVSLPVRAAGASIGRVHVNVEPAFLAKTGRPIIKVELRARVRPQEDVLVGLDLARSAVVHYFKEIFSTEAQAAWGRSE